MTPKEIILYLMCLFSLTVHCCIRFRTNINYGPSGRPSEAPDPPTLDKIHVQDNYLVDSEGRVRLFHGINAVQKAQPWYPDWILNDTQLDYFRQWGFNVVRLGTMWTGVKPAEDVTNSTYLDILEEIVIKLNSYGMYVILDMHQDVASSYYGTYDGVPRWLVDTLPQSPHHFPWPLPRIGQWADGYLTQACGRTFQQIYDNTNHARDKLAEFWTIVSHRFKNHSNVLGYEIINEPWAGDIYSRPSLLLPGNAGKFNLQRLYDMMNDVIRQQDDVSIIFYEPVTYGVVFDGAVSGTGFTHVPGGPAFTNRSVLSYHYYCWILTDQDAHQPYSPAKKELCDHIIGPRIFATATEDVKTLGGGAFLTEFGLCRPDGQSESTTTEECEFVVQEADKFLQSWTYWDSQFFYPNGSVDWNAATAFARPYARVIAGAPQSMEFHIHTRVFSLTFSPKHGGETEIFVPELQYGSGFTVEVSPGAASRFDYVRRILSVVNNNNASIIHLVIMPK